MDDISSGKSQIADGGDSGPASRLLLNTEQSGSTLGWQLLLVLCLIWVLETSETGPDSWSTVEENIAAETLQKPTPTPEQEKQMSQDIEEVLQEHDMANATHIKTKIGRDTKNTLSEIVHAPDVAIEGSREYTGRGYNLRSRRVPVSGQRHAFTAGRVHYKK